MVWEKLKYNFVSQQYNESVSWHTCRINWWITVIGGNKFNMGVPFKMTYWSSISSDHHITTIHLLKGLKSVLDDGENCDISNMCSLKSFSTCYYFHCPNFPAQINFDITSSKEVILCLAKHPWECSCLCVPKVHATISILFSAVSFIIIHTKNNYAKCFQIILFSMATNVLKEYIIKEQGE